MNQEQNGKTFLVSRQVKSRLPRYYRYLKELLDQGIFRISSSALAKMMGLTASQIRQDLNCFGGFGQQGYGYNVKFLFSQISEILGVNDNFRAVLIGMGNLGRAMAVSNVFMTRGIDLVALFDIDPRIVGKTIAGKVIYDAKKMASFLTENPVDIAVLTLTTSAAIEVAVSLLSPVSITVCMPAALTSATASRTPRLILSLSITSATKVKSPPSSTATAIALSPRDTAAM